MNWTAKVIREEFARLDAMTGLKGRELPIYFFYRRYAPEAGFILEGDQPVAFVFNKNVYDSRKTEDRLLMAVVRHEYAHYMDLMRNGPTEDVHGEAWAACCQEVGGLTVEEQVLFFLLDNHPDPTEEDLRKPARLVKLVRRHPHFSPQAVNA